MVKSTKRVVFAWVYYGYHPFVFRMMHAVDWYPTILKLAGLQPGECVAVGAI